MGPTALGGGQGPHGMLRSRIRLVGGAPPLPHEIARRGVQNVRFLALPGSGVFWPPGTPSARGRGMVDQNAVVCLGGGVYTRGRSSATVSGIRSPHGGIAGDRTPGGIQTGVWGGTPQVKAGPGGTPGGPPGGPRARGVYIFEGI